MNKYVIYTSVTGNYDSIPDYPCISSKFDYICFSNDYKEGSIVGHWKIKGIPENTKLNHLSLSRYPKLLPHKLLEEYEWCTWLDANLIINNESIYDSILECINRKQIWCGVKHPYYNCIYQDIIACLKYGKVKFNETIKYYNYLKKEGFPHNIGLYENNIIVRKIHDENIKTINELWWRYFNQYVKRDQFSLYYIFWKRSFKPFLIFDKGINSHNHPGIIFNLHPKLKISKRIKLKVISWINRILIGINKLEREYNTREH